MKNRPLLGVAALLLLFTAQTATAASPTGMLTDFEMKARSQDARFQGFSAERGRAFYGKEWPTADGPQSCSSCHTKDPLTQGLTRANKGIKPLAPAANAARFTDVAKTEKWFRRNCSDVVSRECTPQEKGDLLAYLLTLK